MWDALKVRTPGDGGGLFLCGMVFVSLDGGMNPEQKEWCN